MSGTGGNMKITWSIPAGVMLALAVYAVTFIANNARTEQRLATVEEITKDQKGLDTDIAVLKAELIAIRRQQDRIEKKVDDLAEAD